MEGGNSSLEQCNLLLTGTATRRARLLDRDGLVKAVAARSIDRRIFWRSSVYIQSSPGPVIDRL